MPAYPDVRASWLPPTDPSIFESPVTKAIRLLASLVGADDPAGTMMGLVGPLAVLAPEAKMAIAAMAGKKAPIKAFHGSPHDFEKFSMEKIGTGEGAQAYGHGLYFAENPATAQAYRKGETMNAEAVVDGHRIPAWLLRRIEDGKDTIASARNWFESIAKESTDVGQRTSAVDALKALDAINGGAKPTYAGKMYEVNIHADPEDFLDWDAPLSQQPVKDRAMSAIQGPEWVTQQASDKPGKLAYEMAGGNTSASERLKAVGIPGIKYLDQGSRTAGEGTRNYVVFDDRLVSIVKKYMLAGLTLDAAVQRAVAEEETAQ